MKAVISRGIVKRRKGVEGRELGVRVDKGKSYVKRKEEMRGKSV